MLTHCFAGKDRTGFMVALVLESLGVDRDAIVADFLHSNGAVPQLRDRSWRCSAAVGFGLTPEV